MAQQNRKYICTAELDLDISVKFGFHKLRVAPSSCGYFKIDVTTPQRVKCGQADTIDGPSHKVRSDRSDSQRINAKNINSII